MNKRITSWLERDVRDSEESIRSSKDEVRRNEEILSYSILEQKIRQERLDRWKKFLEEDEKVKYSV